MTLFKALNRRELEPRSLPAATREFKRRTSAAGLLRGDGASSGEAGMEHRASSLVKTLRSGTAPSARQRMQLGGVAAWLHAGGRTEALAAIRNAVIDGRVRPVSRGWWVLVCLFFRDQGIQAALLEAMKTWGKKSRSRFEAAVGGLKPQKLRALPDVLATRVVAEGVRLDEVSSRLQLPAGCPLESEVWARLLSIQAAPWMLDQPFNLVDAQLGLRQGHWSVGAIGRQLLEPAARAGASPSDVAVGSRFGQVVERVFLRLPRDRGHDAWRRLGPEATEVVRWWQTQRDLEKFFQQWRSDPEREAFWRRYVRHIGAMQGFRSASALAMRIGNYWFIEFKPGNACYAYTDVEWQRAAPERRRVRSESDLRNLPRDRRRKHNHAPSGAWQPRFVHWIHGLTGLWP